MADRNDNSIELPPEVLTAAEEYAKIVRKPLRAVIEEALRFYFDADPEQNALRNSVKGEAAALGLTPEEYAQHLVDESRAEWRKPVTLPDELLKRAWPVANRENRSMPDLVAASVEQYLTQRKNLDEMLRWGQEYGKEIGIQSEEDVQKVADGSLPIETLRRRSA